RARLRGLPGRAGGALRVLEPGAAGRRARPLRRAPRPPDRLLPGRGDRAREGVRQRRRAADRRGTSRGGALLQPVAGDQGGTGAHAAVPRAGRADAGGGARPRPAGREAPRLGENAMLTGGCLCGGARYEIDGEIGSATYCHCSQCRRASGTAFATNASVRAEHFRLVAGRDLLTEYESSPGKFRAFCARCGSPILARWAAHPDFVRIRLGTLDDDPGTRPLLHVWVGSKAPWFEITDELPRLQGGS